MEIKCAYTELIDIQTLVSNPRNPNKHSDQQIKLLAKIMKHQGWRSPIVVSKRSGFIVKGHGRLAAAKLNGWTEAPIDRQDYINEADEWADMIADNEIARLAEADHTMIRELALEMPEGFDLDLLGIPDLDLGVTVEPGCDEDSVPEVVEPKTKLGDLYVLGTHRLLCGDSKNIQHVERLMNGEKADMVFTDPPYGVDYEGGTTKRKKLENDHSNDIYSDVLPMLVSSTNDKAPFYIWHAAGYADMAHKISESGLQIRSQIIWNKNQAQFGALSGQYKQKHEPCFYCHKKGCSPIWDGPTNEVTVWDMKRESKNEFHPTQKPVELAERAIGNHKPKSVLDLFGGSGSTLIACEKTNRKCFMMELDTHYCDVIVARWEKYTGRKAILDASSSDKNDTITA
jgi:DNA modification methylase